MPESQDIWPTWEVPLPPLSDPDRMAAFGDALANWHVQFELTEVSHRWIRRELGDITLKEISQLMYEHVAAGGVVDEVPETRPEWSDMYEFHYDIRLTINEIPVYIEARLNCWLPVVPDKSWILVVNVHAR